MLEVRRWAEIRRTKEVDGLSIHEIVRRAGHDRNTVRRVLRREGPPRYCQPRRPSKLDPFKDEIKRLLQDDDPRSPGKRVRELVEELGYEGSKTILDDYVPELGRCSCASAPIRARSTAPASCCSSICSGRAARFRLGTVRRAAAG